MRNVYCAILCVTVWRLRNLPLSIVGCILLCGGCVGPRFGDAAHSFPIREDYRKEATLYSWSVGHGEYCFAIIQSENQRAFLTGFKPVETKLRGLRALEYAIKQVPKSVVITWRDYKAKQLIFPPEGIMQHIKQIAEREKIDLQIIPSIYD